MRSRAEALGELTPVEDTNEGAGETVGIAGFDEQPVAFVLYEIRNAADTGRDDRPGATEGLHDHPAHAFGSRRQNEHRRAVERRGDFARSQALCPARLRAEIFDELLDDR